MAIQLWSYQKITVCGFPCSLHKFSGMWPSKHGQKTLLWGFPCLLHKILETWLSSHDHTDYVGFICTCLNNETIASMWCLTIQYGSNTIIRGIDKSGCRTLALMESITLIYKKPPVKSYSIWKSQAANLNTLTIMLVVSVVLLLCSNHCHCMDCISWRHYVADFVVWWDMPHKVASIVQNA